MHRSQQQLIGGFTGRIHRNYRVRMALPIALVRMALPVALFGGQREPVAVRDVIVTVLGVLHRHESNR
jgi:hypothetical protein